MDRILEWLAALKGIVLEQGADLRFELRGFPEGGMGLLVILGLLLAVFAVFAIYRREARGLTAPRRLLLLSLRVFAVLLVAFVVLDPSLVAVKREQRPGHVILLLDVSRSMTHVDGYRRPDVRDRVEVWREFGVDAIDGRTRLELAQAVLGHEDQAWIADLAAKHRVLLYGFGAGLDLLPLAEVPAPPEGVDPEDLPPPVPRLRLEEITAEAPLSNHGAAVRSALERSSGGQSAIAGVLLIGDGRRNAGPRGEEVARLLAQRKVPQTLVLAIGDPSEVRTVSLARVEAPEKVFQKDPFAVVANVVAEGHRQAIPATLRLRALNEDGSPGDVVATRTVEVGGAVPEARVEFGDLKASQAGLRAYRVEIEPPEDDLFTAERHHRQVRIEVLDEQLRVLLVAGSATYEYRILRVALERDSTIEVACWLQSADPKFPQEGNVSLEELPLERKELAKWDVFVLIDPDSRTLPRVFCENVAKLVVEDGAGMWWICGEKHTLAALRPTAATEPLAQLLPVVPDVVKADREVVGLGRSFPRNWPFRLTTEGRVHQATSLADSARENAAQWARLPGVRWAFPVERAKPGATVLVEHGNPDLRRGDEHMPLLASHFAGAGRVLFSGSDETYLWRGVHEDSYTQFWVKGIRYLFEGKLNAGDSRLRIVLEREKIELGELLEVRVEARDAEYRPLALPEFELRLSRDGGAAEPVMLAAIEGIPGAYETRIRPMAAGYHVLQPADTQFRGRGVEAGFEVVPAQVEKPGPTDLAELDALAAGGGAVFADPAAFLDAARKLPSRTAVEVYTTPHRIWDTWVTVALLLSVLALEWWFRKRFNLL